MKRPVLEREFGPDGRLAGGELPPKRRTLWETMVDRITARTIDRSDARRWRVSLHLKRCPLCSTLNSVQNRECVTCCWSGRFEQDPETIESSFLELVDRCPEIAEAFPEVAPAKGMSWRVRWRRLVGRVFRRHLNLEV